MDEILNGICWEGGLVWLSWLSWVVWVDWVDWIEVARGWVGKR